MLKVIQYYLKVTPDNYAEWEGGLKSKHKVYVFKMAKNETSPAMLFYQDKVF